MSHSIHEPNEPNPYARTGPRLQIEFGGSCLAVISDIHGNLPALEVAVRHAIGRGAELVLCAGDVVGYGPWPQSCIHYLQEYGIRSVQGNYDRGVGEGLADCGCAFRSEREEHTGHASLAWTSNAVDAPGRQWLRELPFALDVITQHGAPKVTVFHGSLRRVNEYLHADRPEGSLAGALSACTAPVAVCGHTHIPYVRRLPGGVDLINCGSVGRPRHGRPACTYVLLRIHDRPDERTGGRTGGRTDGRPGAEAEIVEVSYESGRASSAVLASGLPEDLAAILRTGQGG